MKEKRYHHEDLRQELIDAGIRMIAEDGVEKLSMRRIAAACGVSHTAPYKHFQNKDDMLAAILQFVLVQFAQGLQESVDRQPGTPPERLLELGKGYVQFMAEHPDYLKILFFTGFMSPVPREELADTSTDRRPYLLFQQTAITYLEYLRIPKEEYRPHLISLWALVHGIAVMLVNRNIDAGPDYLDEVERVLRTVIRFAPEDT
ncbi:TetR/AcrR family transcriptional regulator [Anaeromassilibacillus senegalensis]|uniref:TetR/AcrR family transcriptional regulator n=1 Tax=Anaeromassilibacillus senegalensis TaxID=1673717 RepID=UPI0006809E39|nr:TetR/AcrR family transcriptional regulator [Anaeromassilibacillus senegalensis]